MSPPQQHHSQKIKKKNPEQLQGSQVGHVGRQVGHVGRQVGHVGRQVGHVGRPVGHVGAMLDAQWAMLGAKSSMLAPSWVPSWPCWALYDQNRANRHRKTRRPPRKFIYRYIYEPGTFQTERLAAYICTRSRQMYTNTPDNH